MTRRRPHLDAARSFMAHAKFVFDARRGEWYFELSAGRGELIIREADDGSLPWTCCLQREGQEFNRAPAPTVQAAVEYLRAVAGLPALGAISHVENGRSRDCSAASPGPDLTQRVTGWRGISSSAPPPRS